MVDKRQDRRILRGREADAEARRIVAEERARVTRSRAWEYVPGVPAAGHISRGFWHPGRIEGCPKCV